MSVVAVCFAFCMVSAAEALKINGDFKNVNPKNPIPTNWIKNGNGFKDASISIVKEGDKYKFVHRKWRGILDKEEGEMGTR